VAVAVAVAVAVKKRVLAPGTPLLASGSLIDLRTPGRPQRAMKAARVSRTRDRMKAMQRRRRARCCEPTE
jgi:hypothetical protein